METLKVLQKIGLSEKEAKVYLAILKLKKGLVTTIAEAAGVNRTTTYDVLKCLNQKGLVLKYIENNKTGFTTEGPQKIKNWLTQTENQLDQQKTIFQENFEKLKYLFCSSPDMPKFKYYEGKNMVREFFADTLECLSQETIGYTSSTMAQTYQDHQMIKQHTKDRFLNKIKGRYFIQKVDTQATQNYLRKYYLKYLGSMPDLVKVKVLPTQEKRYFINEINIYDNKLSISHSGQDFFGLIIEDQEIANTQKMIFDVLWKKVKEEIKI